MKLIERIMLIPDTTGYVVIDEMPDAKLLGDGEFMRFAVDTSLISAEGMEQSQKYHYLASSLEAAN